MKIRSSLRLFPRVEAEASVAIAVVVAEFVAVAESASLAESVSPVESVSLAESAALDKSVALVEHAPLAEPLVAAKYQAVPAVRVPALVVLGFWTACAE